MPPACTHSGGIPRCFMSWAPEIMSRSSQIESLLGDHFVAVLPSMRHSWRAIRVQPTFPFCARLRVAPRALPPDYQ